MMPGEEIDLPKHATHAEQRVLALEYELEIVGRTPVLAGMRKAMEAMRDAFMAQHETLMLRGDAMAASAMWNRAKGVEESIAIMVGCSDDYMRELRNALEAERAAGKQAGGGDVPPDRGEAGGAGEDHPPGNDRTVGGMPGMWGPRQERGGPGVSAFGGPGNHQGNHTLPCVRWSRPHTGGHKRDSGVGRNGSVR